MSALDVTRFRDLWQRLGCRADASNPFILLAEAYAQPHRAYHNAAHIADCLHQLDHVRAEGQRLDEVEAALWFHDIVYDPHASDNEEKSADWATRVFREAEMDAEVIRRIAALILVTKHDREPHSSDAEILLDVDLSILGREPSVFAEYERCIREEYSWVPEDRYRTGRSAILTSFLQRPIIYRTKFFRDRLEDQARKNLEWSIAQLTG